MLKVTQIPEQTWKDAIKMVLGPLGGGGRACEKDEIKSIPYSIWMNKPQMNQESKVILKNDDRRHCG